MSGLDAWLAGLGGPGALGLAVAVLLGLRHASDPDHLTAVSTLLLSDERAGARRAGLLGLSWGLGHAVTLFAFGVPVILFRRHLPPIVQRGAEFVIGLVILGLALRLLLRWRRGYFHSHSHQHGHLQHSHPHAMAMVSSALGYALARGDLARRFEPLVPVFGAVSLLFGAWYAASALLPAAV